jgi:hypothetical protein
MHKTASDCGNTDSSDLCALCLIAVKEKYLLEPFTSLFISMTKCICGSITTGEKSIHVCANNGMQRAAFNLLNRLFGAQQIQIVFDIFIENILSELVHLPQDLILVFRQTCLTIAIWTIECDID